MGGRCKGHDWVDDFFNMNMGGHICSDCHSHEHDEEYGYQCQVVNGQEPPWQCPEFSEFLDFEAVPVPKKLKRKSWG